VSYVSVVLGDAPVHYWRLTDPGGGLLHDIGSGPRRALTVVGQSTLPYTGPISDGGSCWFDANAGAWHFSGDVVASPFSIECWVWRHSLRGSVEAIAYHAEALQFTASNHVLYATFGDGNIDSGAVLSEQAWHHIIGTFGPAGGGRLYIDAIQTGPIVGYAALASSIHTPSVGMSDAGGLFGTANIAEFATYGVELSAAQVTNHFVAADNIASRPVYRGLGTLPSGTGGVSTVPELNEAIIGYVSKLLQNTP